MAAPISGAALPLACSRLRVEPARRAAADRDLAGLLVAEQKEE